MWNNLLLEGIFAFVQSFVSEYFVQRLGLILLWKPDYKRASLIIIKFFWPLAFPSGLFFFWALQCKCL